MPHQMARLHSGTQREHKDFSSDAPSIADVDVPSYERKFWKVMVVAVVGLSLSFFSIGGLLGKGLNHLHVQTKGVYQIFGVPETSEFAKPPGLFESCGFP